MSLSLATIRAAARVAVCISGDLDFEQRLHIGNALVELIANVDVLSVAEKRTLRLAARRFTTALEIGLALDEPAGLAVDLAIHIGFGVARTRTTRLALGLAICGGRSDFALGIAFTVACGFAGAMTTTAVRGARTRRIASGSAVSTTTGGAFELAGIHLALRLTTRFTTRGTRGLHRSGALSIATDIKLG